MRPIIQTIIKAFAYQEDPKYKISFRIQDKPADWPDTYRVLFRLTDEQQTVTYILATADNTGAPLFSTYDHEVELKYPFEIGYPMSCSLALINTEDAIEEEDGEIDNMPSYSLSEWSNIVSLVAIGEPALTATDLTREGPNLINRDEDFIFRGTFSAKEDHLAWYRICLSYEPLHSEDMEILENESVTARSDTFKYTISKDKFTSANTYTLYVLYKTLNNYVELVSYPLNINAPARMRTTGASTFVTNSNCAPDLDNTALALSWTMNISSGGKLEIKRASDRNQFSRYDTLVTHEDVQDSGSFTYVDTTVEPGTTYRYKLVFTAHGQNSVQYTFPDNYHTFFDHAILSNSQLGLQVTFNPQITGYSHVRPDSVIQTIGSRYPYVSRAGDINYRQFTLTGLISYHADIVNQFTEAWELSAPEGLSDYQQEIIKERKFREKVMDFLYDSSAKLFRSPTEGAIIVRLTNVSFTPNTQLGRLIYSFSAQATEIAQYTPENCALYKLTRSAITSAEPLYYNMAYVLSDPTSEEETDAVVLSSEDVTDDGLQVRYLSMELEQ